jgi:SAM-dependent methyltransferase
VTAEFFRALARAAARRYRAGDRYARHYAYGKLTRDPVFRHLLERGLIASGARVLDLGCGQGLLAALYAEAHERHGAGDWPAGWTAPGARHVHGIDLMPRDIERARAAGGADAEFTCADIRDADFGTADAVVMLDVLHYVDYAAQDEMLERARRALGDGGVLLLRVADASSAGLRLRITLAADRLAMLLRGRRFGRFHTRALCAWQHRLAQAGFRVEAQPMSAGTPFANVLLVGRCP